jgi:argonaute-like protein implicated in RNA metabolism and viral defense
VPISAAIAGSEVAITVESMFSMNNAKATISGTMRSGRMEILDGARLKTAVIKRKVVKKERPVKPVHNSHPRLA